MASVTWPPRVTAAPISSSVKVVRARRGTAPARRPTSVVRSGGTAAAVVSIGRTGEGGRAVARLDTVLNHWRPPSLAPHRRPRHAHAAERVPVNFSLVLQLSLCLSEPAPVVEDLGWRPSAWPRRRLLSTVVLG